jgi:hypothetical protein
LVLSLIGVPIGWTNWCMRLNFPNNHKLQKYKGEGNIKY